MDIAHIGVFWSSYDDRPADPDENGNPNKLCGPCSRKAGSHVCLRPCRDCIIELNLATERIGAITTATLNLLNASEHPLVFKKPHDQDYILVFPSILMNNATLHRLVA